MLSHAPIATSAGFFFPSQRDTQCGFKMLRGEVARLLFGSLREMGYLVDLELMLLTAERGYRVVEVPITWQEMPESKVSL